MGISGFIRRVAGAKQQAVDDSETGFFLSRSLKLWTVQAVSNERTGNDRPKSFERNSNDRQLPISLSKPGNFPA